MLDRSLKPQSLTLPLKAEILHLLELLREQQAAAGETPISDAEVSKACFDHPDFVTDLRAWQGGPAGPTLDMTMKVEAYLISRIRPAKVGEGKTDLDDPSRLWLLENADALASSNHHVRQMGLPLATRRVF